MPTLEAAPLLAAHRITKAYGGVVVLADASISLTGGRVDALVGENGAGKSTMLGVLAGRIAPTAGTVRSGTDEVTGWTPRASRAAGVAAVYQELTVLPALTAWENVVLGRPSARLGFVSRRRSRAEFTELADSLHVDISPDRRAGELSVARQQMLEIMRAVRTGARVLLLDEPTASLASAERAVLLELVRTLADRGVAVGVVSHNLEEILQVSDQISVFREGRVVAAAPRREWTTASLVQEMLGRDSGRLAAAMLRKDVQEVAAQEEDRRARRCVLSIDDLCIAGRLSPQQLRVDEGEIVGIGGLVGSGRSTLLRALAGSGRSVTGELVVDGRQVPWPRDARTAIRQGFALVPEERKRDGLVPGLSASTNIVLSDLAAVSSRGWVSRRRVHAAARRSAAAVGLPDRMLAQSAGSLSGGNQQKAVLARWLHRRPRVLLADEPGRGVDLGAKAQILASLRDFVDTGGAVLMASSESEELLAFADRILVMSGHRVVADLDNSRRTITEHDLLRAAFTRQEEL